MQFLDQIDLGAIFNADTLTALARVVIVAAIAFVALRVIVTIVRRVLKRRTTAQVTMLVTKTISYAGFAAIVVIALLELGVNLTPLLGAAGIVGLAVGIASQASLSNMISGLFLVSEKPFAVGDVIIAEDTVGIVDSIDLLSVKIRTFDNLFIRLPNEKLAGAKLTNITRYPIRRLDIKLVVPFSVDLARLGEILRGIAARNPLCLQEPAPLYLPDTYLDWGTRVLFGVWFARDDFLAVKSALYAEILATLAAEGIRLAVPRSEVSSAPEAPMEITVRDPAHHGAGQPATDSS